jgi:hypothetical protein
MPWQRGILCTPEHLARQAVCFCSVGIIKGDERDECAEIILWFSLGLWGLHFSGVR